MTKTDQEPISALTLLRAARAANVLLSPSEAIALFDALESRPSHSVEAVPGVREAIALALSYMTREADGPAFVVLERALAKLEDRRKRPVRFTPDVSERTAAKGKSTGQLEAPTPVAHDAELREYVPTCIHGARLFACVERSCEYSATKHPWIVAVRHIREGRPTWAASDR